MQFALKIKTFAENAVSGEGFLRNLSYFMIIGKST